MEEYKVPPAPEVAAPYIDDLLRALEEAQGHEEQGVTSQELADSIGWSTKRVLRRLHELKASGRLEIVKMYRQNIVGVTTLRSGYRLK